VLFLLKLLKLLEENFCELGVEDVEEEEEEDVEEGEFVSPLLLISMSFCSVWNGYLGVGGLVQSIVWLYENGLDKKNNQLDFSSRS